MVCAITNLEYFLEIVSTSVQMTSMACIEGENHFLDHTLLVLRTYFQGQNAAIVSSIFFGLPFFLLVMVVGACPTWVNYHFKTSIWTWTNTLLIVNLF